MNKKQLILAYTLFISLVMNAQTSNRVKLISENPKEVNYIKADDFYLTHYLYIDFFLRESLLLDANKEEVLTVINSIKKYVSVDNPLVLEIKKTSDLKYLITVVLIKKDNKEILAIYTNWNPQLKKFEDSITEDSYTRWYFVNNEKFTYRKDISEEKDYTSLRNYRLANAYLFDELTENDNQIEKLFNSKEENENLEDYLYSQLVKLKYYMLIRNELKINQLVEHLKIKFSENNMDSKLKGLETAFNTTLFQIELMK